MPLPIPAQQVPVFAVYSGPSGPIDRFGSPSGQSARRGERFLTAKSGCSQPAVGRPDCHGSPTLAAVAPYNMSPFGTSGPRALSYRRQLDAGLLPFLGCPSNMKPRCHVNSGWGPSPRVGAASRKRRASRSSSLPVSVGPTGGPSGSPSRSNCSPVPISGVGRLTLAPDAGQHLDLKCRASAHFS